MYAIQGSTGRRVRTLFVSDAHLGCRYANVESLLHLLHTNQPESIYLVGDIIDGWRLRKYGHWPPLHTQILRRLLDIGRAGTRIYYTPGNHDEFMRSFALDFGFLEVANEFVHETAIGQYYLVTHGDRFDDVELRAKGLSLLGSFAYDRLCAINGWINLVRRGLGLAHSRFSSIVKRRVKRAVRFVSDYEQRLSRHARSLGCDGVICGHVHTPTITQHGGITYCNTGDWVESRSALVEYTDGQLELIYGDQIVPAAPPAEKIADAPARTREPATRSGPAIPTTDHDEVFVLGTATEGRHGEDLLQHGWRRKGACQPCASDCGTPATRA
jgi:UDP-2,3-diacylglucosamine pyrophosphatase LpxH